MARLLLVLLALFTVGLTSGPAFGQERLPRINPLTGKPFGPKAIADYEAELRQIQAEEDAARKTSDEGQKRWEEARARNADRIRAFDDSVEGWRKSHPSPAGTRESMVATSYDGETALPEDATLTYFNGAGIPTHVVQFGPDGRPTGPVTLTQQGKAWETIGPHIPPGGMVDYDYSRDFDGVEIIKGVRIADSNGRVVAKYDFNFDGIAWRGQTFDGETGVPNGGFQDERLKPPPATVGGPLPVPAKARFATGLCEACRALTSEHNDVAEQINAIVTEMASLSEQNQHALPPAQKPIRMRYAVLEKQLAVLTARLEDLHARLLTCAAKCQPAEPTASEGLGTPPAAPAKPKLPAPALSRPQFERVPELTVPVRFCSEFERNDYLTGTYNPAVASALRNATVAQAHQATLNALFTQYMQANSEYWAAVRAERDAWEPIATAATARAEALRQMYAKIMAVPVVPCTEAPTRQPPPPPPPPTDGPAPVVPEFETLSLPPSPDPCSMDSVDDYINQLYRLKSEIHDNLEAINSLQIANARSRSEGRAPLSREAAETIERQRLDYETQKEDVQSKITWAQITRKAGPPEGCHPAVVTPPEPTDGPVAPPVDGAGGTTEVAGVIFPAIDLPPLPPDLCAQGEAQRFEDIAADALKGVADNEARLKEFRGELEEEIRHFTQTGDEARLASARSTLESLKDVADRIARDRTAAEAYRDAVKALAARPCPPPTRACPPKHGRDPIEVGSNSKVGSGAQLRAKVGGMAMGALMGAIGGGGGGGGGSDGPDLWTCKIKDSEYTVFDDPATGVSLKVGAKRAKGGKVVIFSEIAKSPDKGTFQTAFLENPTTGETQGPTDVGPCDLWGEWKLTVSWTKTTYVNGQVVDRQSGGWSKTGLFSIPGALSKVDAPDGLWKRMGFSSASNGAREIGMIYDVPAGGGPLTFVIHVTRPKGDPVTTVPFVLTLTEGPKGFVFTKAEDPPCPEEKVAEERQEDDRPSTVSKPVNLADAPTTGGYYDPGMAAPAPQTPATPTTFSPAPADYTDEAPPRAATADQPIPATVFGKPRTPEETDKLAREFVDRWRAEDADDLIALIDHKCDAALRAKMLKRVKVRRESPVTGYGPLWKDILNRALELDKDRLKAVEDLLEADSGPACPIVPDLVRDPPPLPPPPPPSGPTFTPAPAEYTPPADDKPDDSPM